MSDSLVTKQQNTDKTEEKLLRSLNKRATDSRARFNILNPPGTIGPTGESLAFPPIPEVPRHRKIAARRMSKLGFSRVLVEIRTDFTGVETVRNGKQSTKVTISTPKVC